MSTKPIQIENKTVVQFHYRLRDESTGNEVENSYQGDPIAYLHGFGNIMKGLEAGIAGHEAGDVFSVALAAKDAYGERKADAQQRVPIKHLHVKKNAKLKAGDIVNIQTSDGVIQATVIKPGKFNVDVDTNHPLADKDLCFDIEVMTVREATEDEIAHKHAHGVGGHHHE
jgi:FKBP-type peptidyl-prolyl cis-trans isomerase SlyD